MYDMYDIIVSAIEYMHIMLIMNNHLWYVVLENSKIYSPIRNDIAFVSCLQGI